ncbi:MULTISPECIES: PAS domain S-box protein [unclassified Pseudodesulfovibrio]|uniref:PAS domain S-box protein n=1 Tax=unclassified Pseudodesulfovibrio TaxID=2661612 RepID=UPI000FEBC193|nr:MULTISPECIES: PAS domain S-box protein [unclassified Pseudodesulfovibrio]MCJ2165457.1 PAS domain S-box protein [Pseudodesulfovibrio sp. S3-i]RWU03206.1 PAS domain S-box protein [Pseudodesulfovibrio sp. S3]
MLKRIVHLIPLLAGLVVVVVVTIGYRADQENHAQKVRAQVVHALTTVKSQLEIRFESTFQLVNSLKAFLQVNPEMDQAEFQKIVEILLAGRNAVRSLQLAKNDIISHAYPADEREHAFGRAIPLSGSAALRVSAIRAKGTGQVQILVSNPRSPDRSEVVVLTPVLLSEADGSARYWGLISVTLDSGAFYLGSEFVAFEPEVMLALRKPESSPARDLVLAGDPVVFDMDPIVEDIHFPSGHWQLAAAPGTGRTFSPYGVYILTFGGLLVLLLPASFWAVMVMILGRLKDRERYYQLIHNAKSIILRIDMSGEIDFCNEYAEEFYGYAPGELLGKPFVGTLIPRKDAEGQSMRRYLNRLLKNPLDHSFDETMSLRKNGEIVWVAWANDSVLSRDGAMVGVLCVGTDITDRKLMEETLRQREKQYRLLAENVTDIIWGVDADSRFTYVSPSDEVIRGFKRYDVLGRPIQDFLSTGSRTRFNDVLTVLNDQVEQGDFHASITEDMEFLCVDGSTVWLESRVGVLLNDEGDRIGLQGVSRDITDRKLAETLRDDMERMARHDLKTPLGAVVGLPEEIRRMGGLTTPQAVMLDTIEKAGDTMLHLINRSLDLYKMECGTYVLERTTVDVLQVIERIKVEALSHIREKGISVGIEAGNGQFSKAFPITVDKELFKSMLSNLIRNALEASPESGSISILLEKGENVTIRIRNQGEVPWVVRETFFDKYSTSNPSRGSGLGTYSARLIARTHGGDITLDAGHTGETCVVVTLPLRG